MESTIPLYLITLFPMTIGNELFWTFSASCSPFILASTSITVLSLVLSSSKLNKPIVNLSAKILIFSSFFLLLVKSTNTGLAKFFLTFRIFIISNIFSLEFSSNCLSSIMFLSLNSSSLKCPSGTINLSSCCELASSSSSSSISSLSFDFISSAFSSIYSSSLSLS